jgi:predicted permease
MTGAGRRNQTRAQPRGIRPGFPALSCCPAVAEPARLLLSIFTSDLLPIFLVAGVGFLVSRFVRVDVHGLARTSLYGLAPCLIFDSLVRSTISGAEFGRMALLCIVVTATMGLIGRGVALVLRLDRGALVGFLLTVMFSNGGNYGLPVVLLAFGQDALAFATVYFVTSSVLTYTAGVSIAASGQRTLSLALRRVARLPTVYAVAAAGLVLASDVTVPRPIATAVQLLGNAALPVMILVLGMQLERARRPSRPSVVAAATALSLLASPAVAFAAAHLLDLSGPAFQAGIVQASMPTAVVTTVLALEFDVDPAFVTSVVVASTAISPLTLTLLIAYLQNA